MNTQKYERAFIDIVEAKALILGLSRNEFGRRVFEKADGGRTWRLCRSEGRSRSISLAETVKIAEVLGEDFPTLIWQVHQEIISKELATD